TTIWSSTGATSIPWTGSPRTGTYRTWSRGGVSTAPSGPRGTSGSGTRRSGSGPGTTRPSTATCRSSAWRQPPRICPPPARATPQPPASAPAPLTSRPSRRTDPLPRDSVVRPVPHSPVLETDVGDVARAHSRLIVSGCAAALVVAFEGSDGLAPEPPAGCLAWLDNDVSACRALAVAWLERGATADRSGIRHAR